MVSFSGVGSGIDFGNITKQLVAVERLPIQTIQSRKDGANRQVGLFADLAEKLKALNTAATALDDAKKIRTLTASSTREERIKVTANGSAEAGTYDITVDSLAAAEVSQSARFLTDTAGIAGTGTLNITSGTDAPVAIDFDATMNLSDIAAAINDSDAAVNASVLFDGTQYRLIVTGQNMGAANALSFTETGSALGFTAPGAELVAASDATATINGVQVSRTDNTFDDVIPGVSFDLRSRTPVGEGTTRVTVAADSVGLKAKVQSFVKAVNDVQGFMRNQLSSQSNDPKSSLRGDPTVQGLQRRLSLLVGQEFLSGTVTRSLGGFGVAADKTGVLILDDAKFDAAVSTTSADLVQLLAGEEGGLTGALKSLTDDYTRSSTGMLASRQNGLRSRIQSFDDQISRIEDRASALETRLQKQFSAADSLIGSLNSQMTYISKIFG